jgi:hypothetical protein
MSTWRRDQQPDRSPGRVVCLMVRWPGVGSWLSGVPGRPGLAGTAAVPYPGPADSFILARGNGTSAGTGPSLAIAIIAVISSLCLAPAACALQVRRLHDTGRSGWWILIGRSSKSQRLKERFCGRSSAFFRANLPQRALFFAALLFAAGIPRNTMVGVTTGADVSAIRQVWQSARLAPRCGLPPAAAAGAARESGSPVPGAVAD